MTEPTVLCPLSSDFWSGGVAQLGERLLCKQEVVGSIPITSTRAAPKMGPGLSGGLEGKEFRVAEGRPFGFLALLVFWHCGSGELGFPNSAGLVGLVVFGGLWS